MVNALETAPAILFHPVANEYYNEEAVLTRQLSAEPERAAAAAYYLGELGAEANSAVLSLEELVKTDNDQVKQAARQALDDIAESTRSKAK